MTSPVSSSSRKDVDLFMSNEPRPIISINQGRYRGSNLNPPDLPQPIQRWLNIPYAFPPTGNLRFRPPFAIPTVPEDPNRPITDASEWGFRCPDSLNPTNDGTTDEKCLNLNVFRPKNYFDSSPEGAEKKPLLPVLLYIHGGGFNGGSARERMMSNLVSWAYSPIIAVSINYRVGPFGFLSGKVALGDGENGGVNVGLKDQRCAMLWVQKNIEAFGGDPNSVTLLGVSAGAHSIGHHLNNPPVPSLFHRAILESGSSTGRACYTPTDPLHTNQWNDFISIIGCTNIPDYNLMHHLRTLPTETIHSAAAAVFRKYNASSLRWPFQPVIEGDLIPRRPSESLKVGIAAKIPILTGFNSNEGSMFIHPFGIKTGVEFTKFWKILRPDFTAQDFELLEKLYPNPETDPKSPFLNHHPQISAQSARLEAAYSDYAYISPVQQTALSASKSAPTYLYEFALKKSPISGADHVDHVHFVTKNTEITSVSETWRKISDLMCRCWVGFIVDGDPNSGLESIRKEGNVDYGGSGSERKSLNSLLKLDSGMEELKWEPIREGGLGFGRMVFGEGNTEGEGWAEERRGDGKGEEGLVVQFSKGVRHMERRAFWWERS